MSLLSNTPEKPQPIPTPESGPEIKESPETKDQGREKEPQPEAGQEAPPKPEKEKAPTGIPAAVAKVPDKPEPPPKDVYHQRVERVLEDGLVDEYLALPADKRQRFKQEGERVAVAIRQMMERSRIKVKDVLKLILNWLKVLPNPNKWFLEQEAKIKTDRIVALAEEKRKEENEL